MDYFRAAEISASGMLAQKLRIEAAASNIANMTSTSQAVAELYRPLAVVMQPRAAGFASAWSRAGTAPTGVAAQVVEQGEVAPRVAYEPGHPHADSQGMVRYPGVDQVKEMMAVTTALRAYEANLAALNASKIMASRALEIGGQG